MDSDADGVNDFLQRIRELGDKRDREDEERARRLEQEIIAGREARRARRDERARSLSPQKDSPLGTPTSIQSFLPDSPRSEVTGDVRTPRKREDSVSEAMEKLTGGAGEGDESAVKEQRRRPTGPLSWQRRPKSNTVSSSSSSHRPSSDRQAQQLDSSDEEIEKRRSQIALNLSSKDPSWFRQTADRGTTSGALRKAQDEGMSVTGMMALPGMSTDLTIGRDEELEPIKQSLSARSSNETLKSANFPSSGYRGRSESMRSTDRIPSSTSTASGLSSHSRNASLSSSTSIRFDPPGRESLSSTDGINRPIAMSPSQGRISPERRERTPSPTKGLGSFVQSAMLKREGSINKRWSNSQQPGSLSRNNSSTGSGSTSRPSFPRARDLPAGDDSRESSPAFDDVSGSGIKKESTEGEGSVYGIGRRGSTTEGLSSRYPLTGEGGLDPPSKRSGEDTPPSSPSKTFDQKRWSPTKSSWLESALKKGAESPQFSPPPMKPLVKPFEKPPLRPFEKKLPETASTPIRPPTNPKPPSLSPKPLESSPDLTSPKADVPSDTGGVTSTTKPPVADKPSIFPKPSLKSPINTTAPPLEKPPIKPKEPLNLRAGLKPRPVAGGNGKGEELPFLNAMSRLRSVKTQNYAAPNELKERILAGKANLQATGGPQKNKGPDPLKETLLSAKGSLRHSNSSSAVPTVPPAETKPKLPDFTKQVSASAKLGSEAKGSTLANRFNPNLASFLQRGPPGMSPGRSLEVAQSEAVSNTDSQASGKALTHMTKGRARGPKRRAPTTKDGADAKPGMAQDTVSKAPQSTLSIRESLPSPNIKRSPSPRLPEVPRKPSLPITPSKTPDLALAMIPKDVTPGSQKGEKPKPPTPAKSSLLRSVSNSNLRENAPVKLEVSPTERTSPLPLSKPASRVFSRDAQSLPNIFAAEKDDNNIMTPVSGWIRPVEPPIRAKTPIRLPKRGEESSGSEGPKISSITKPKVVEPELVVVPKTAKTSEASQDLIDFFKGPTSKVSDVDLDVMAILSANHTTAEGVKTLKVEVSEISGNGKLQLIPQEMNNVFCDGAMYICLHNFETKTGSTGQEVYLWNGDRVPEASVEDAQLFARKTARDNGGKLVRLRQGRETSSFFEALGGVIITRRGSRPNLEDGHPYALCGRSCSGNIAFDEVDCSVSSLCSGFPFIVSAKGNVFLWKGKGSTVEELGVARLIAYGMPECEVQEIEEGKEPEIFFDAVEGSAEDRASADYWHLKPSYRSYSTRLHKVDLNSKSKLIEIFPFCQSDLDSSEIYVVDAFFELYIVLGANSQDKRAEFETALKFAQEYAMLAASVNDRPFIPVSSVIVGGAPREFKVLFRNWEDSKIPTTWQPTRKPSLRLVGLSAAMEAMSSK